MKHKITIFIAFVFTYSGLYSQVVAPENLELTVNLEKDTYLVDEPIYAEFVEINRSNMITSTSGIRSGSHIYCKFHLSDESGNELLFKGGIEEMFFIKEPKGTHLNPGDRIIYVLNLLGVFGEGDENHRFSYYLKPGKYTLWLEHHTNARYPWEEIQKRKEAKTHEEVLAIIQSMDRGTITSNRLVFNVVEPTGEEAIAHQKYLEVYRNHQDRKKLGYSKEHIADLWRQFIEQFPNSVYNIKAFKSLIYLNGFIRQKNPDYPAVVTIDELISRYENSYFSYYIVNNTGMLKEMKDIRRYTPQINTLQNYIERYPDSRFATYAHRRIKWLEQKRETRGD